MLGGPAFFLSGNIWIKAVATRQFPVSHIAGLALLAAAVLIVPVAPNYIVQAVATAVLFIVALWEYLALRRLAASTA